MLAQRDILNFIVDFNNIVDLNKQYGRWTDRDDILLERKNRKDKREIDKQSTGVQEQAIGIVAEMDDTKSESLVKLLDSLNFPNALDIKQSSDELIDLLTSEETDQVAIKAAWVAYGAIVESYADTEYGKELSKFQIAAIIHKALIFHWTGDTFRYLEELQDAKDYAANSNMDEVEIEINDEIESVIETFNITPEIVLIKIRPYISYDNYESLRDSMFEHEDLEDLVGDIYGMLIEEGEDPDKVLSQLKLTEEYLE